MTNGAKLGTVLMFDDQGDRENRQGPLEQLTGCTVAFVDLHDKDVMATVRDAAKEHSQVDVVLMDYILDKTSSASQELLQKSGALAPIAREHWPTCPIIAVTEAYETCVKDVGREVFDDIVRFNQLSWLAQFIPSVITGYRRAQTQCSSLDDIYQLLGVPDSQKTTMSALLPDSIKGSFGQWPEFAHHLFRWFRKEFYVLPGLLLDRRWVSLVVGVDEAQFDAYSQRLQNAEYAGVFRDTENPRWWKAGVYEAVLPQSSRRLSVPVQQAACEAMNVSTTHYSKCYKCNKPWPEVIAFVDEEATADMYPMHLRCTRKHSKSISRPFYEERRVMLGDQE